ncbi:hypothetical protein [Streptobacillus moniliformis]|uniref:hypothetical protein n=1 Tax=Streptobacillus moniliformis TaxID=34105 RepID=UPI0007E37583|nr:hypothetical protein [Streptobacillus moniliformis]
MTILGRNEIHETLINKKTADFLGCSQSKIRIGLQRGLFTLIIYHIGHFLANLYVVDEEEILE